jgi:hypothetical protein
MMIIVKTGVYTLLENCVGLLKGSYIKVIKVREYDVFTSIHKHSIYKEQPVVLVKESFNEV